MVDGWGEVVDFFVGCVYGYDGVCVVVGGFGVFDGGVEVVD